MTPAAKIMEIDINKLQPNTYNPRKTMDKKGLASLGKSLEQDGQLQTILVRPIESGKYEVVAGMRRYLSLKSIGEKKAMCTVQEMDVQIAMQRAFKENVEREALSPVDEAMWFFEMLGLKEEQLFVSDPGAGGGRPAGTDGAAPLPSEKNPAVKTLADTLGGSITANLIENRLPLLALPDIMQRQVGRDDGVPIEKAKTLARLRLIGDKADAQKEMSALWKESGEVSPDSLNERVTSILDTYKKKSEDVLKELVELERNLKTRATKIVKDIEEISDWIDPKSKSGLYQQIPETVRENLAGNLGSVKAENLKTPQDYYDHLDELVNTITRDKSLSDEEANLSIKLNNLLTGQKHIEDHECVYCGTHVNAQDLGRRIEKIDEERDEVQANIKLKDTLRGKTEKLGRYLGQLIREFADVAYKYEASLKTLVAAKKLTKEEADARREQFLTAKVA